MIKSYRGNGHSRAITSKSALASMISTATAHCVSKPLLQSAAEALLEAHGKAFMHMFDDANSEEEVISLNITNFLLTSFDFATSSAFSCSWSLLIPVVGTRGLSFPADISRVRGFGCFNVCDHFRAVLFAPATSLV